MSVSAKVQKVCVWCGPAGLTVVLAGLVVAGWFPPPSPHATAGQVALMYQTHAVRIRIAALVIACGGAFTLPCCAVISAQMRRIEGRHHPLSYIQLGCATINVLLLTIPTFFWEAAAYDPQRTPEITQALHVGGWLPFISAVFPAVVLNFSIAGAVLRDRRATPILPRWVGYANLWLATLYMPSGLALFFHHGPFAWNGIFTFWLGASAFGAWFVVMVTSLLKAIAIQEADELRAVGSGALGEAMTV